MMTISLDMTPTLSADGSKLAVRVANVEENRFDQLIEVEQDGKVIGSYKGLKPGEKLDEIDVTGAKPGAFRPWRTASRPATPPASRSPSPHLNSRNFAGWTRERIDTPDGEKGA